MTARDAAARIPDGVEPPKGDATPSWVAAHAWTFRATALLLDSPDGVEEVAFSDEESVPVTMIRHPYVYLADEYRGWSARAGEATVDHEEP